VREALRGPREVHEIWATERAAAQIPWVDHAPRRQVRAERELTAVAGTREHQGVVAWCDPYRYSDAMELVEGPAPLVICLDQVTDPQNFGAVVRSAEVAGATGVVVPAHGSARVTAAVAKASAGAVEHVRVAVVPNLARYLTDVKGPNLWAYAADAEGALSVWDADLSGGVALVLGAEGRGVRPLVRRSCDAVISIPLAGRVGSLNVAAAAAVLLFEARRQRTLRGGDDG
jgi:23S rRNA (guanosine2251-2'-O)-methyltransferase